MTALTQRRGTSLLSSVNRIGVGVPEDPEIIDPGQHTSAEGGLAGTVGESMGTAGSFVGGAAGSFLGSAGMAYQVVSAIQSPILAYKQAKTDKRIMQWKADLLELQQKALQTAADDVMRAGHQQIASKTFEYGQQKSATRAHMGASGVRVNARGSSAELLASIDIAKESAAQRIYANAVVESWGYRKSAINYANEAKVTRFAAKSISPWAAAVTDILTMGSDAISSGKADDMMSQLQTFGSSLMGKKEGRGTSSLTSVTRLSAPKGAPKGGSFGGSGLTSVTRLGGAF